MHPIYNDFNYLYRDIIMYCDKLRTNYYDNKLSLSSKSSHDCIDDMLSGG